MNVSHDDLVAAKIREIFPNDRGQIATVLATCCDTRVQLAILKLTQSEPEKFDYFVEAAKIDWRDVLAWAEYPEELRNATWEMKAEDVTDIMARDKKQYLAWLNDPES